MVRRHIATLDPYCVHRPSVVLRLEDTSAERPNAPTVGGMTERLGILGGTFDPVHVGHVVGAVEVAHALALDRVLFVVAGDPWQKHGEVVAPAGDRVDMVVAATEGIAGIEVSTIEVERSGPSYMLDTLRALERPERQLFLIVGSDVVSTLDTWHRVDDLKELAILVILDRAGTDRAGTAEVPPSDEERMVGWKVERVPMPRIDISSTELRARLGQGRPVDGLISPQVVRIINERRLYTAPR